MYKYEVTISDKYPVSWETPSVEIIAAKNSKDAIKMARKIVEWNGYTRMDGPKIYKAKRI